MGLFIKKAERERERERDPLVQDQGSLLVQYAKTVSVVV